MKRDAIEWLSVLTDLGVRPQTAAKFADAFAEFVDDEDVENAYFLGQVLYESGGLERMEENLNYRAERLVEVWPSRFPTLEIARQYERNPAKLAEKVYQGRMGNTEPGDGFKYRGRGPIHLTGRDNYTEMAAETGLPLVESPDLVAQPYAGIRVAVTWFRKYASAKIADGVDAVTYVVNGGYNGLQKRTDLTIQALERFTQENSNGSA